MDTDAKGRVVLICVDASTNAEQTFDCYVKNVKKPNDYVILGHVPELYNFDWASPTVVEQLLKEEAKKVDDLDKNYKQKMSECGLSGKFKTGEGKKVGEVLLEMARRENVGIICIGSRGLGTLRRTFLGSVSSFIVHHAHVPVLVCKSQKQDA